MSVLIYGFTLILTVFLAIWLWRNQDEARQTFTIKSERRRFWIHALLLAMVTLNPIYIMLIFTYFEIMKSLFEESSGTWHQTIVKDSSQEHEIVDDLLSAAYFSLPLIAFMYANLRLIYFEKVRKIPYVVFLLIRYIAATTVLFYLTYISEILPEYVVIILDSISFVEMLALAAIWLQVITYGRRIYINIP